MGFSIDEFIDIIQHDKTLEEAFINLRKISYSYENEIKYYNRKNKIIASHSSSNIQHKNEECQWMEILNKDVTGKYNKRNGSPRYYTSKLYERIFLVSQLPCDQRPKTKPRKSSKNKIIEKRINELKKLIYRPGQKANIPLIGSKTAIFSKKMIDKYDFSIESGTHSSGMSAYIFRAKIKPHINANYPDDSVVKFLEVYVQKDNLQVLTRNYKLQYNSGIYQFDILMKVDLSKHNDLYIPSMIHYNGYWNIIGKRREDCIFNFNLLEVL